MSGKTYLVEAYLSKANANGWAGIANRAEVASDEMRSEGIPVRYVRSIFIPQDETCFHIFEAGSEHDVRTAAARAGIHSGRVLETTNLEPANPRPRHDRRQRGEPAGAGAPPAEPGTARLRKEKDGS